MRYGLLTADTRKKTAYFSWDVLPCTVVEGTNQLVIGMCCLCYTEDGGSLILRNFGASHVIRQ